MHGDVLTGECNEGLRDLMKGICWKVYRDVKFRERYLKDVENEIRTEEEYKKWLMVLDTSGEMVNGCRLTLNIWKDRR